MRVILCVLSGTMLGFSFPPFTFGILACFGLVPLLVVLADIEDVRPSLGWIYLTLFAFHIVVLNWTGGYEHGNDKYMMVAGAMTMLLHPLLYLVLMGAYMFVKKHVGAREALVSLPFLWVGYEYCHSLGEWSFPWLTLGNSQSYDITRIQFISATGVYGLSFWILVINVLTFELYSRIVHGSYKLISKQSLAFALVIALVYVAPEIHGRIVLAHAPPSGIADTDRTINVGMVQSNIDPWEKWKGNSSQYIQYYLARTESLSTGSPKPDVVLWPETAVTYYILTEAGQGALLPIREEVEHANVSVLTGFQHAVFYEDSTKAPPSAKRDPFTGRRYDVFNAATLIQPGVEELPWYGKMKMVPIAERVPYADAFHFLDFLRWDVGIGGWQVGPDSTIFEERKTGARFCSMICYESTYPGFVAGFVRKGAEFIAIITIDSWWGHMSGAFQHHQFAIFRAIENRRWIARCAVGGISSYIDPYGRVYDKTELFTQAIRVRTIGRSTDLTLYSRVDDLFAQICSIVALIILAAAIGERIMMNRRLQH